MADKMDKRINQLINLSWYAIRYLANKYHIRISDDKTQAARLIASYEIYYGGK